MDRFTALSHFLNFRAIKSIANDELLPFTLPYFLPLSSKLYVAKLRQSGAKNIPYQAHVPRISPLVLISGPRTNSLIASHAISLLNEAKTREEG